MKSRTSVALLWVLVFILGGITGAVTHYLLKDRVAAAVPGIQRPPRDVVEGLARDLDLDVEQKRIIKTIIGQSAERYRVLAQQFRPQYEAIRSETDQRIKETLRGDQKERFERFLMDLHSRH